MDIAVVVSLIAGVIAAIMSFLVSYRQRLAKQKEDLRQKELSDSLRITLADSFRESYANIDADRIDDNIRYLRNYLVHLSPATKARYRSTG